MRAKQLFAAAALTMSLSAACSGGAEQHPQALKPATPTTQPENPNRGQSREEHTYDLVTLGLQEARENFAQSRRVTVIKGLCVGWEARSGYYAVTLNPGFYVHETDEERLSFLIFTSREDPLTPLTRPDIQQIYLMNGPEEYARKTLDGYPQAGTHFAQPFDIYGVGRIKQGEVTANPELSAV